jgi:hypothetical protein
MEHEGKGVTAMTYAILKRGATRRDEWGPRPGAVPRGGRRKGVGQGSLGGGRVGPATVLDFKTGSNRIQTYLKDFNLIQTLFDSNRIFPS